MRPAPFGTEGAEGLCPASGEHLLLRLGRTSVCGGDAAHHHHQLRRGSLGGESQWQEKGLGLHLAPGRAYKIELLLFGCKISSSAHHPGRFEFPILLQILQLFR